MTDLDYGRFEALTFDCYGTLIDWEAGIVAGLRPVLAGHDADLSGDDLLEEFAGIEAAAEAGPYLRYREILALAARGIAARHGIEPDDAAVAAFGDSVGDWPAFPDSAAALARLHERFRLGVITNCDDDLFARSAARLGTTFDWVVTAEQAGSYKPDRAQLRGGIRADRAPARPDPPRRPEPLPRPRPGEAARSHHRLDRPPSRPPGRRHAARRRRPGCHVPGHGVIRRRRDRHGLVRHVGAFAAAT